MAINKTQIFAKDNEITLKKHTEDILDAFEKLREKIVLDCDLNECIKWAIKLHDLGKVLPYFQIVVLGNNDYEPWDVNKELNIYHSLASILFINQEKLKEKIKNNDKDLTYILSAIAYHHWKNSLEMDLRFGSEKFEKLLSYSSKPQLIDNLKEELRGLLEDETILQFNEVMCQGLARGLSFADYVVPPYQLYWLPKRLELDEAGKRRWILISGFLQRCDHYASFSENEGNQEYEIDIKNIDTLQILNNIKQKISTTDPIWQESKLEDGDYKNNLILIAPTGSGKTEFAFLWSDGEKFFYTLPLRAAVEQTYDRAINIFGCDKVGVLHSDADIYLLGDDHNYERIKVYEVAKQLSYPVIVSTGDQFFPYSLRPPGYERIYATFSYSRLVIDEIQAYDPRATAIVIKFVEDIQKLGGKFLLMTATLPEYASKEISNRVGNNGEEKFAYLNIYEEEKGKYVDCKKHRVEFFKINNKKKEQEVDFSIPEKIFENIIKEAENNKRVLVILNTIKQATDVYEKIKKIVKDNKNIKIENVIIFHSQFTLNEKKKIKSEIETKFKNPKEADDKEGKILIATQVIEAAIDIDADILYTEICPMDALVQRMGRVLRRYKDEFDLDNQNGTNELNPNIYILVFKEGYESGNGRVYEKELIEKTLILLKEGSNPDWKNYYDNFKEEKEKLKKSEKIVPDNSLLLSEYDKYIMVKNLYESLNSFGKYLSKFYETLSILDAGFMSDRKEEAQKIFREIMNASVIDISKIDEFLEKIKNIIENSDFNYTKFKKEVIAEFVISIPYWNLERMKKGSVIEWLDDIKISTDEEKKRLKKVKEWCSGIFFADLGLKNVGTRKSEKNNLI